MTDDFARLRNRTAPDRQGKGTWCSHPDCKGEPLAGGMWCTKPGCLYDDDPMESLLAELDAQRSEAADEIEKLRTQLAEARTVMREDMEKAAVALCKHDGRCPHAINNEALKYYWQAAKAALHALGVEIEGEGQ